MTRSASPFSSSNRLQSQTTTGFRASIALKMPEEHGAWGILLVPFFCAAAVADRWNAPLLLAGACTLSLFLLHSSVEARNSLLRRRALLAPTHLLLATVAIAAAAWLVFFHRSYELVWLGLLAAGLYLVQRLFVEVHRPQPAEKRSLLAQLVGVTLLSLTAPLAWISARGSLLDGSDATGVKVWLLNLLFFLGGVLYVKYRVRGLAAHRDFQGVRPRLAFAWPVILYHSLLLLFLAGWITLDTISAGGRSPALGSAVLALAFAPGTLRAHRLLFDLGRRFPIRCLGWSEILHSVLFAALLILAFRLA